MHLSIVLKRLLFSTTKRAGHRRQVEQEVIIMNNIPLFHFSGHKNDPLVLNQWPTIHQAFTSQMGISGSLHSSMSLNRLCCRRLFWKHLNKVYIFVYIYANLFLFTVHLYENLCSLWKKKTKQEEMKTGRFMHQ